MLIAERLRNVELTARPYEQKDEVIDRFLFVVMAELLQGRYRREGVGFEGFDFDEDVAEEAAAFRSRCRQHHPLGGVGVVEPLPLVALAACAVIFQTLRRQAVDELGQRAVIALRAFG